LRPVDLDRRGYGARIAMAALFATVHQLGQVAATSLSIESLSFVPLLYLIQIGPALIAIALLAGLRLPRRRRPALPAIGLASGRQDVAGAGA
jgi:hypothetical protein